MSLCDWQNAEAPLRTARLPHPFLAGQTTTLVPSVPYSESAAESDSSEKAFPSGIFVLFQQNDGMTHGISGPGMPPAIVWIVCKGRIHILGLAEAQCAF